jgi:uncharacterized protein with FMN-binding domain
VKRALLVTAGTVAGLVSVLTYSAGESTVATASDIPGGAAAAGLGGPADDSGSNAAPGGVATPAPGKPKPAAKPTAKATTAAVKPTAAATTAPTAAAPTAQAPAPTQAAPQPTQAAPQPTPAAPKPKPTPTKTVAPKPTPTPTKTASVAKDYFGTTINFDPGAGHTVALQVGIRVKDGKIIDAWASKYPMGTSEPYSVAAIPALKSQTIAAQSARLAGFAGASFTSQAWVASLSAAISKAGL